MGIEEDRIELTGSPLEKKLAWMRERGAGGILVQDENGEWQDAKGRPNPGAGSYIEVMSSGEIREYSNARKDDTNYQRLKGPDRP